LTGFSFAAIALGCCLGKGRILMGKAGKLTIEIRRPENEYFFLEHQARQLNKAAREKLQTRMDLRPGEGLYNILRFRARGEEIKPLYRLLYFQDRRRISRQVLEVAGLRGIANLWFDCGHWVRGGAAVSDPIWSSEEWTVLRDYLRDLGYDVHERSCRKGVEGWRGLIAPVPEGQRYPPLVRDIYRLLPKDARPKLLRPGHRRINALGGIDLATLKD